MTIQYKTSSGSPLENNIILLYDDETRRGILVDPSFESKEILDFVQAEHLVVDQILFTHGHFDHFAGLAFVFSKLPQPPSVGLHEADLALWRDGGGSRHFRIPIDLPGDPDFCLVHGQQIRLGNNFLEVRHTPGHSPGSVVFYIPSLLLALTGDLVFHHGVGRTDLQGGNLQILMQSILSQVYTLPRDTLLIPGHGPETTVAEEMDNNPYVRFPT